MNNQDQNNVEMLKTMIELIAERDALKTANADLLETVRRLSRVSPQELELLIQQRNNQLHYAPLYDGDYIREGT